MSSPFALLLALAPLLVRSDDCSTPPQTPSELHDQLFGDASGYRLEDRPGIWQARRNGSAVRHTPPPERVWVQVQFLSLIHI